MRKYIFVKDGCQQIKICIEDILLIQSEGNYLNMVTSKEKVLALMTFQYILEKLPANLFFRTHNSYVINLRHIQKIEDKPIFIHELKIPIGIKYKDRLLNYLHLT